MKLYVDDMRPAPPGWQLARTVEQAVDFLKDNWVDELSLDYMIGNSDLENFSPVARFILTLPREKRPRRVSIHTSSPRGARLLRGILEGAVDEIVRV